MRDQPTNRCSALIRRCDGCQTVTAFDRWWQDEGIDETIDINDAALVRRIRSLCEIAWSNGEYKARESEMQTRNLADKYDWITA